jgi:hypothetical protein
MCCRLAHSWHLRALSKVRPAEKIKGKNSQSVFCKMVADVWEVGTWVSLLSQNDSGCLCPSGKEFSGPTPCSVSRGSAVSLQHCFVISDPFLVYWDISFVFELDCAFFLFSWLMFCLSLLCMCGVQRDIAKMELAVPFGPHVLGQILYCRMSLELHGLWLSKRGLGCVLFSTSNGCGTLPSSCCFCLLFCKTHSGKLVSETAEVMERSFRKTERYLN